jgi:TPR repeat protein
MMTPRQFELLFAATLAGDDVELRETFYERMVQKELSSEQEQSVIQQTEALMSENMHARTLRAAMHIHGIGGDKNILAATALLDESITQGDAVAMYLKSVLLRDQKPQDWPAIIQLLDNAAALEHRGALFVRGLLHREGLGGDVNFAAARDFLLIAREFGSVPATVALAEMMRSGLGVGNNEVTRAGAIAHSLYKEAHEKYRFLITLGHSSAMHEKAMLYQFGLGGPRNFMQALRLYSHSARLNREASKQALASLKSDKIVDHIKESYERKFLLPAMMLVQGLLQNFLPGELVEKIVQYLALLTNKFAANQKLGTFFDNAASARLSYDRICASFNKVIDARQSTSSSVLSSDASSKEMPPLPVLNTSAVLSSDQAPSATVSAPSMTC